MSCLGCELSNKKVNAFVVYEDRYVTCILDHDPYNEGHVLILTKQHFRYFDEIDLYTGAAIMRAANVMTKAIKALYNPEGISVIQNGGSFDDLKHFHMHLVPRYKEEDFSDFFAISEEEEKFTPDTARLKKVQQQIIEIIKVLD